MRVLIASDIHGDLESVRFLQEKHAALKPQLCVLLGDYLYHGPRNPLPKSYTPMDVAQVLGEIYHSGKVIAVRGNCDALVDEQVLPFPLVEHASIYVDGRSIFCAHGHQFGRDPDFSSLENESIALTGHVHFYAAEQRGHVLWLNPGSISLPKQGNARSYAVYENNTFTVYDTQDTVVLQHCLK